MNLDELRKITEEAKDRASAMAKLADWCTPDAVLALLERVEAAEAKASREVADIVRVSAVTYEATQQAMSVTAEVLAKMGYEGLTKRLSAAEQALQRVRELHTRDQGYCGACDRLWPCPAVQALVGEEKNDE